MVKIEVIAVMEVACAVTDFFGKQYLLQLQDFDAWLNSDPMKDPAGLHKPYIEATNALHNKIANTVHEKFKN